MAKISYICIIDDDPIQIFLMRKNLSHVCKYDEILVYKNGKEAYDELKELHRLGKYLPNILFLDINMPVWDGWIFYNEFSNIFPNSRIPMDVYILTSSINQDDLERATLLHLENKYIKKLASSENLKGIIENAITLTE